MLLCLVLAGAALAYPSVSTDDVLYEPGVDTVFVDYNELPGNAGDWVSVAREGDPLDYYVDWAYTGGSTAGTVGFEDVPVGRYVARAYADDSYSLLAESHGFDVIYADGMPPAVHTDSLAYLPSDRVSLSWDHMPGTDGDWVGVATLTTPREWIDDYAEWDWTGGTFVGNWTLGTALTPGRYHARAFQDGGYAMVDTSPVFTVDFAPAWAAPVDTLVFTDLSHYVPAEHVTVQWDGAPGNTHDWLAMARFGEPEDSRTSYYDFVYLSGETEGSHVFTLPAGTWVARVMEDDSYTLRGESHSFTVAFPAGQAPELTVLPPVVSLPSDDGTLTVSWERMPGFDNDWIGVATEGSSVSRASAYVEWIYTEGQTSGSHVFGPLPTGDWRVRALQNDRYDLVAESEPVHISYELAADPRVSVGALVYAPGDPIVVDWENFPGFDEDWVGIAPLSKPSAVLSSYTNWTYTGGAYAGSTTFEDYVLPGLYVARGAQDDGYAFLHHAIFSVEWAPGHEPSITSDRGLYNEGDAITLTYTDLPGDEFDWVGIAPIDAPVVGIGSYPAWTYTGGVDAGAVTTDGSLEPGTYVARAFHDNTYVVVAESDVFSVLGGVYGCDAAAAPQYVGDLAPTSEEDLTSFCDAGWRSISGDLLIEEIDDVGFTTLDGLSCLEEIGGDLIFAHNRTIESLAGLSTLRCVRGSLSIHADMGLDETDIGLLQVVQGNFSMTSTFWHHHESETLDGFNVLSEIGGDFRFSSNGGIDAMSGFDNLDTIGGSFMLGSTDSIEALDGFGSLRNVMGDFTVRSNTHLDPIQVQDLHDGISYIGGTVEMTNNNPF